MTKILRLFGTLGDEEIIRIQKRSYSSTSDDNNLRRNATFAKYVSLYSLCVCSVLNSLKAFNYPTALPTDIYYRTKKIMSAVLVQVQLTSHMLKGGH